MTNLFDLLDALELDEKDDGIDLVLVKAVHRAEMNVQDTMLILEIQRLRIVPLTDSRKQLTLSHISLMEDTVVHS